MLNENFVYVGVLIIFIGDLTYLIETIKGNVRPNRVSWFLWALAPLIASAASFSKGAGAFALIPFSIGIIPPLVLIASFLNKKSYWEVTFFDIVCGIISLLGLYLWYTTQDGNTAILFSIIADAIAYIPTFKKSWTNPESESYKVFLMNGLGSAVALLALRDWNFQSFAFPLYMVIINGMLSPIIKFKLGKK